MRFERELVQGIFVERISRFSVVVVLGGKAVEVHLASSGRLWELLVEGCSAYVTPVSSPGRKTAYDLLLMGTESGTLVSVDARLPNFLFREAFRDGRLSQFDDYQTLRGEVSVGRSRLDFALTGPGGRCFVEVKSITLVEGGVGLFPDGPTVRGVRHLRELAERRAQGDRAVVVFCVQRFDVTCVAANDGADPVFGQVLREVVSQDVEAFAFRCRVSLEGVWMDEPIPVILE